HRSSMPRLTVTVASGPNRDRPFYVGVRAQVVGPYAGPAGRPAASASPAGGALPQFANFPDLLTARTAALRQPIQIIRRSTCDELKLPSDRRSRQDEATRAWNLHVALYYKAGGIPWRLQRNPTDLTTCYVGIACYQSSSRDTLETSVAQVFN